MNSKPEYKIYTDIKYGHSTLIDLPKLISETKDQWFNQSLTLINDDVARIGIIQGEFHWHKHDDGDEFFLVLDGKLILETEEKIVELSPLQGFTVPKGVLHKTSAPVKTVMLMIGKHTVKPTGD